MTGQCLEQVGRRTDATGRPTNKQFLLCSIFWVAAARSHLSIGNRPQAVIALAGLGFMTLLMASQPPVSADLITLGAVWVLCVGMLLLVGGIFDRDKLTFRIGLNMLAGFVMAAMIAGADQLVKLLGS
jgi:hypothetical protein